MSKASSSEVFVALLRGINVGGRNKLPMAQLTAIFAEAGAAAVSTYIQSGNVVFRAGLKVAAALGQRVSAAIAAQLDLEVPVILRSATAWRRLASHNPFVARGLDAKHLHVACLADAPSPATLRGLDAERGLPDELAVVGSDVYLYCPNGMARTKLSNAYLDRALATTSTMRNWRTVQELLRMVDDAG